MATDSNDSCVVLGEYPLQSFQINDKTMKGYQFKVIKKMPNQTNYEIEFGITDKPPIAFENSEENLEPSKWLSRLSHRNW